MSFNLIEGDVVLRDQNGNPVGVVLDGSVYRLQVETIGTVTAELESIVDAGNSTTAPIGAGGSWSGTAVDTLGYASIIFNVTASTNGGLLFQFSNDGSTNWFNAQTYTYLTANGVKEYTLAPAGRYFRAVFSNSGQPAQTYFRVQTRLIAGNVKGSSIRVGSPVVEDDDAEVVKSVLVGRNGFAFKDILTEPDGRLMVSAAAAPPPDTTPVLVDVAGTVSTSSDEFYVIPNAAQLYVQQVSGSGQSDVDGTEVVLYYDPNGDLSVLTRIATGVVSGNTFNITLSYQVPDLGDGTRRMVLRRNRLSGGGIFVEASFRGYYE